MIRKIEESRPFNEVETYLMTINPNIISAKDLDDGVSIPVAGYLLYEDVKEDGHSEEIMAVITPDRKVYAFQSATFKKSIKDISNHKDCCHLPKCTPKVRCSIHTIYHYRYKN